jgi:hypothetical protein
LRLVATRLDCVTFDPGPTGWSAPASWAQTPRATGTVELCGCRPRTRSSPAPDPGIALALAGLVSRSRRDKPAPAVSFGELLELCFAAHGTEPTRHEGCLQAFSAASNAQRRYFGPWQRDHPSARYRVQAHGESGPLVRGRPTRQRDGRFAAQSVGRDVGPWYSPALRVEASASS